MSLSQKEKRSEKLFTSQERVSGFPEKGADLRGSPGNLWGSPGNFWGSLGNCRGTPGLLLSFTVRELPGKSGELPGKSGDFPEARGSLTPSQRLAKFVSKKKRLVCLFQCMCNNSLLECVRSSHKHIQNTLSHSHELLAPMSFDCSPKNPDILLDIKGEDLHNCPWKVWGRRAKVRP